ncbi:DNA-processing protein DprA [Alicyclobacillus acidocaldarius]|uniref:DNA-processing protein DprA n=1 Tax=Alicyclobacillus acidocaldarius TaxID=405212 RepID=UPI0011D1E77C|nr:DNA-processing protein DprA [Alicyclobacillus acidocaldarius]
MREDELRKFIADQVMFTHEVVQYLGISPQRLHQLVKSGKLIPVKQSRSSFLFLRKDVEERKNEVNRNAGRRPNGTGGEYMRFENDPKIVQDALNYFTIQSLCKWAPKRTRSLYDRISACFDMSEPIVKNLNGVSQILQIDSSVIVKTYASIQKGFSLLPNDTHISRLGQETYPPYLALTHEAPLFLFMRGNIRLPHLHCVAIVGTRNPTQEGIKKASALAALLGKYRIVVVSGLARGIDRAAHEGALRNNIPTIAVIGTPITKTYPKEHERLQAEIAERGLLISQFAPLSPVHKWNFPARNAVMSGICLATVIVEAGETSGALIQADYALKQDRFVLYHKAPSKIRTFVGPKIC